MVVTKSMSSATNGQREARKGRLGLGTWPDVVAAVVATLTLLGGIISGVWGWDWLPGRSSAVVATATSSPPAPPPASPSASPPASPSGTPASSAGVWLDTLQPVVGQPIALPAGLDPAKFPHAVAVECPTNGTGDLTTVLKYQLRRGYRVLAGTLVGWSAGSEAFRVQLTVVVGTKQPDDQIQSEDRPAVTAVANGAPVAVRTDITASGDAGRDGLGADEIELQFGCEQPHDAVILSGARVSG